MTQDRKDQLKNALMPYMEDEAFMTALMCSSDTTKMCELLSSKGIDVSAEDMDELIQDGYTQLSAYGDQVGDELSEDQLEEVAGGGKLRGAVRYGLVIVGAVAVGAALGGLVGIGALAVSTAYLIGLGYSLVGGVWTLKGRKKKGW